MSDLVLTDVSVTYRRRDRLRVTAVAGVDLTLRAGEVVGLVGESGSGKSSLARAALGLIPIGTGSVSFGGRPVTVLTARKRKVEDTRLQMVFQNPYTSLNPRRRVGSQIADGVRVARNVTGDELVAAVASRLTDVGLSAAIASRLPHQISGGQRQRIAIARVLAAQPAVIVLDEPLASLDVSAQAQISNLLIAIRRQREVAMLIISHDLNAVSHVADRIAVMYLGQIVEMGPTRDVFARPLHPYTKALLAAIPKADGSGTLPEAPRGEVPDPARPPSGCRFHPRCPVAFERCPVDRPSLIAQTSGRKVACWLYPAEPSSAM
ncbi:MAG TPA: ABC transporter ATP-binding protein [Chloroflexi bacterium]|jgi:peptide/nickel transport system ATP-binding protein|nr:ABC transporter ATP-binding protein [Chloroflexota bacterium]